MVEHQQCVAFLDPLMLTEAHAVYIPRRTDVDRCHILLYLSVVARLVLRVVHEEHHALVQAPADDGNAHGGHHPLHGATLLFSLLFCHNYTL